MPGNNILVCDTLAALSAKAAQFWAEIAEQAIGTTGRCTVALSGGSTPRSLYQLLAKSDWVGRIDWPRLQLFWGDERCVGPDHPESNYGMARETLLSRVPILEQNVHRIPTELVKPEHIALAYEQVIQQVFGKSSTLNPPQFDLMLLGLGENGHTASLFPYSPLLKEREHLVAAAFIHEINAYRVTLTLPVINNARNVVFLVAGESKAEVLRGVLNGKYEPERLPAQLVKPVNGLLTWILDRAAAQRLQWIETTSGGTNRTGNPT